MKRNNKRGILYRFEGIILLLLLFTVAITAELVRTTVVDKKLWDLKAQNLYTSELTIVPLRGSLYADNGSILAANITFYDTFIDFSAPGFKFQKLQEALPALCDSLAAFRPGRTAQEWKEAIIKETERTKKKTTFVLFKNISFEERQRLRTFPFLDLSKNRNGFYYQPKQLRTKPYGAMAARSIGNVGEGNNREIHGRSGLEMALDKYLYGIPGVSENVQITSGMTRLDKTPAVPGYDITTTINVVLQDIVEEELEKTCTECDASWGTAVLMDVKTGEIKAISNLEWNKNANCYVEGINHAVLGYEPGSVMKPISMMIALEDGLVDDINEPIPTGRTVVYEGRNINDPHGGAALTPRQIIETSSNIGMSKIITSGFSKDKGYAKEPGKFRDRLESMGFFEPYNSGIGGEQVPMVRRLGNTKADRVALTRMAYGYSTLIPPLRTLAMYNAIANDGKLVRPHLVKKFSRPGEPDSIVPVTYIRQHVCDSINAAKLRVMLHDVVWGEHGTARLLKDKDVEIAGKTGTCFTTNEGRYTSTRRLAFCGFFPYSNPQYSCIVLMLGANRGAAASSGTVLKNVARKMYAHGMLGPNKNTGQTETNTFATLYGSSSDNMKRNVERAYNIKESKVYAYPKDYGCGVPNVKGLNIREAIKRLEDVGLVVRMRGCGYVTRQSLEPGTAFKRGQVIHLVLSTKNK